MGKWLKEHNEAERSDQATVFPFVWWGKRSLVTEESSSCEICRAMQWGLGQETRDPGKSQGALLPRYVRRGVWQPWPQARSLWQPHRGPIPCIAPLWPHPVAHENHSLTLLTGPLPSPSEFLLTLWQKHFPGLLNLKGDNFRQPETVA